METLHEEMPVIIIPRLLTIIRKLSPQVRQDPNEKLYTYYYIYIFVEKNENYVSSSI
jgi:hypothetical protein